MIRLHTPDGTEFFLNADLVESVATEAGTIVTLFDGRRLRVEECASTIVERIRSFRASILREAEDMRFEPAELVVFPGSGPQS